MFQVNCKSTKTWSDVCPKLPINTVESRSGVLLLTLNIIKTFFSVSIVDLFVRGLFVV